MSHLYVYVYRNLLRIQLRSSRKTHSQLYIFIVKLPFIAVCKIFMKPIYLIYNRRRQESNPFPCHNKYMYNNLDVRPSPSKHILQKFIHRKRTNLPSHNSPPSRMLHTERTIALQINAAFYIHTHMCVSLF